MILLLNHHPINILFLPGMRNLYRGGSVMILLYIEPPSYKDAVSARYEEVSDDTPIEGGAVTMGYTYI